MGRFLTTPTGANAMTTLYAQPYNIDATGFYFDSLKDYETKAENLTDRYGQPVEEFEIQFIDGDAPELFEACRIHQGNLDTWFDEVEPMTDYDKIALYFLCNCQGYQLDNAMQKLEDVSLSETTLQGAAEEFFDEIYLPEIPESVRFYIDYAKFARDCEIGGDMTEFEYNGTAWTCTNACCV
jgi:hypothetical protein